MFQNLIPTLQNFFDVLCLEARISTKGHSLHPPLAHELIMPVMSMFLTKKGQTQATPKMANNGDHKLCAQSQ